MSHVVKATTQVNILIAALLVLCATGLTVYAQERYPPSQDKYVTDDADDWASLSRSFSDDSFSGSSSSGDGASGKW